jgi:hypothetical protein
MPGSVFQGLTAAGPRVRRDLAPARNLESLVYDNRLDLSARQVRQMRVLAKKYHAKKYHAACVKWVEGNADFISHPAQKVIGFLHQQPAAIAGLAFGGHRAAVGQARQRFNGGIDQPMARLAVHLCDQAKPATVSLELRTVQACR